MTPGRLTFKVRATALLVAPGPAQASTMRARVATAWLPLDRSTAPERVPRVKDDHEISFYAAAQLRRFLEVAAREWIP